MRDRILPILADLHDVAGDKVNDFNKQDARSSRNAAYRLVLASMVLVCLLAGLAVTAFVERNSARSAERLAEQNAAMSEISRKKAEASSRRADEKALEAAEQTQLAKQRLAESQRQQRLSESRRLVAQAELDRNSHPDRAILLSIQAFETAENPESRRELLISLQHNSGLFSSLHVGSGVYGLAFSPNGRLLATGSVDGMVRLWDLATRRALGAPLKGHKEAVLCLAFSPDGRSLVSGSDDNEVREWNVSSGTLVGRPFGSHTLSVVSLAFSPDGTTLASASRDRTIKFWNASTHEQMRELAAFDDMLTSVSYRPDGKLLASTSWEKAVRFWDPITLRPSGPPIENPATQTTVAFSPDGRLIASAGAPGINVWDVDNRRRYSFGNPLTGHTEGINSLSFSPDGKVLASGSADQTVRLWNPAAIAPAVALLRGHTAAVTRVTFSPDGTLLASASEDRTVRLWNLTTLQSFGSALFSGQSITAFAFSSNGGLLATADSKQTVRIWNASTLKTWRSELTITDGVPVRLWLSSDGGTLATLAAGKVSLWDVNKGRRIGFPISGPRNGIGNFAVSPEGKVLATSQFQQPIRFWDLSTQRLLAELPLTLPRTTPYVAFHPYRKIFATVEPGGFIRFRSTLTRRIVGGVHAPSDSSAEFGAVAFSPDGKLLASTRSGQIWLWNVVSQQLAQPPIEAGSGWIEPQFSPDSKLVAWKTRGTFEGSARLGVWDIDARRLFGEYFEALGVSTHPGTSNFSFSPNGSSLTAIGAKGALLSWAFSPSVWMSEACRMVNRNLSIEEWKQSIGDDVPYRKTCPEFPVAPNGSYEHETPTLLGR